MRYSVIIYDAVGIEEATIVCESKADAQEMAVRCAKMYAGEGYIIEVEREPERWEGFLGTRELRRRTRREGKRRTKIDEPADAEGTIVIPIPVAAEQPPTEEPVPDTGERRRRGSRRGRQGERQPVEAVAEEPVAPIAEALLESGESVETVETPEAGAEEQQPRSRRRRGGRRRRSSQREAPAESSEAPTQTVEETFTEVAPEPTPEPEQIPAQEETGEQRTPSRRRRGGRRHRPASSEPTAEVSEETPHTAEEQAPAPIESVVSDEPSQPKRRRTRSRKPETPSEEAPQASEAPAPTVVGYDQPAPPDEPQPNGGNGESVGVSWRRPRRRRSRKPEGEQTEQRESGEA